MHNSDPEIVLKSLGRADEAARAGTAAELKRGRISQPRSRIPLPPYDVRVRRELAQRRLLVAVCRHLLRILTLHVADAGAGGIAVFATMAMVPTGADTVGGWLLIGLLLVGLNAR